MIFKKVAMGDEPCPNATPNSTKSCPTHVESLRAVMETLDVNNEKAKVKTEIELSKVHWSELASAYYTAVESPTLDSCSNSQHKWVNEEGTLEWKLEVAEDNVLVFRSLQEKYPRGFFVDENDLGPNSTQRLPKWMLKDDGTPISAELRLSSVTPFAEGGQAQLFYAHMIHMIAGEKLDIWVMKVFKEGMPLRDLLNFFPTAMLSNDQTCIQGYFGDGSCNLNSIGGVRLLKSTGRFAFLMGRAWGDLWKLIKERMSHFNNQGLPFQDNVAFYIIHQIALGMQNLHERDIVHRDLKAANVLVFGLMNKVEMVYSMIDPIHLQPHEFQCLVADFECSVGIVGTGFWRAPEILQAVKNRNIHQKPELFTKQADVYSFGMTCYEILSGGMPFEELRAIDYDGVIGGVRPMLPNQTSSWIVDLVNRCWHKDPLMRPSFEEIVEILEPYVSREEEEEESSEED